MITEDLLEQEAIAWFQDLGYQYVYGPDIAPDTAAGERESWQQVMLMGRLEQALVRINPAAPASAIADALHKLQHPAHPVLLQNNRDFHKLLTDGVNVDVSGEDGARGEFIRLVDFDNPANNELLVANQFTIKGEKQTRRPDLVVFINGLPLAVIELKNPVDESADIWKAFEQLQTYKEEISDLFIPNAALIISDGLNARIGSLTADRERFTHWRSLDGAGDASPAMMDLEVLVRGLFDPRHLFDYLRHFILFEQDGGKIIKKIAGYHQFFAVRKAVEKTIAASSTDNNRCGVVWHTQGSGKSISMACYAGKVIAAPELNNPTIVVVTDRTDLDGQLFQTFCNASDLLRQQPEQAEGREDLRNKLSSRAAGGVIFTTIQKFALLNDESVHPVLSNRANLLVISDEAHRSQYGFEASFDRVTGKLKYGYAKHLRDAIPNARFIGFTGTPIEMEDKDTRAVFGDYIDVYDIERAVKDGATVPIYYESRLVDLQLDIPDEEVLDTEVETIMEAETEYEVAREKSRWAALEKLAGAETRLEQVAKDLVKHFEDRQAAIPGKGLIVCMSREICVDLYAALVALRPEWHDDDPAKGAIKVVMTGSASDKPKLRNHVHDKQTRKDLENRIKDPKDSLQLVIVRDMWLTGFDAPCLHTMYIDKPMRGHNLMQAIARVNRVFRDKPGGLVVDYIGIAAELKKALHTYTANNGKGKPTINTEEALAILLEKVEAIQGLLHGIDYADFMTKPLVLLPAVADHVLGLDDGKRRFSDLVVAMTKAFALCGTMDEAVAVREEIAFYQMIKAVIVKKANTIIGQTDEQKQQVLRQILNKSLVSGQVVDIFTAAGLDKPNIAVLSDEFLEEVRHLKYRNLAVELLEKLLNDEIKARLLKNVVQAHKYSDLLKSALNKYKSRAIETAQVIEELIQMAKEFREAAKRGEELRLNQDELAFYDALEINESAVRELGEDILRKIAIELTQNLRKSTSVDWAVRESVRAQLRLLVKRILRKYRYPPDKTPAAVELVLQQAEVLSAAWG